MRNSKTMLLVILSIIILAGIGITIYGVWFFKDKPINNNTTKQNVVEENIYSNVQKPIATIEVKDFGIIKVELEPSIAPETVANFISLANSGFYDGLTFHRTIPEFMIQGGDKEGTGAGEFDYTIKGEFTANGVRNNLKHTRGVISMARADYGTGYEQYSYNSAGSQFFIMVKDIVSLNGYYASFGTVIEGMDVVDRIVDVDVLTRDPYEEGADKPVDPPVITSINVETFGVEYGEPDKLNLF